MESKDLAYLPWKQYTLFLLIKDWVLLYWNNSRVYEVSPNNLFIDFWFIFLLVKPTQAFTKDIMQWQIVPGQRPPS